MIEFNSYNKQAPELPFQASGSLAFLQYDRYSLTPR